MNIKKIIFKDLNGKEQQAYFVKSINNVEVPENGTFFL